MWISWTAVEETRFCYTKWSKSKREKQKLDINTYIWIRSDQSLSRVWLFSTPWITARQASLSITNSRSSLRLMSIKSVMPSSHKESLSQGKREQYKSSFWLGSDTTSSQSAATEWSWGKIHDFQGCRLREEGLRHEIVAGTWV